MSSSLLKSCILNIFLFGVILCNKINNNYINCIHVWSSLNNNNNYNSCPSTHPLLSSCGIYIQEYNLSNSNSNSNSFILSTISHSIKTCQSVNKMNWNDQIINELVNKYKIYSQSKCCQSIPNIQCITQSTYKSTVQCNNNNNNNNKYSNLLLCQSHSNQEIKYNDTKNECTLKSADDAKNDYKNNETLLNATCCTDHDQFSKINCYTQSGVGSIISSVKCSNGYKMIGCHGYSNSENVKLGNSFFFFLFSFFLFCIFSFFCSNLMN